MPEHPASINLGGSSLRDHRHVCAFFTSTEEEYRVMVPFIREGLSRGERAVHLVPHGTDDHVARLRSAGIDVDDVRDQRQLDIVPAEDVYTPGGVFDCGRMLGRIEEVLDEAPRLGYSLTRVWAHAEFVCAAGPTAHEFLEYETRLNYLLPRYPDAVVCVYDLEKVGAGMALDVLRTHPVVIVGHLLQENPYFIPPDVFLGVLAARRTSARRARHGT
ncbi:MAG TPA: MEDS domain-containing protein [Gemmatimonadaceae bacterium]|jgi:MEDS: MEthanogen/methylotroph, DcmR Sensory domain|nr:MEDS domain-containing protein [Gemmatimonadaceae bacterium]